MNKSDLQKKLENFNAPKIKIEHHKNQLRRELLNSDQFHKKGFINKFQTKELVLASGFSVLLVAFLLFQYIKTNPSKSDDLIRLVENNYAGIIASDKTNFYDSELRLFGNNNEKIDLKVEKWINHKRNKFSVILKDITNDEILDKLIIDEEKIYRMKDPKIEALNTRHDTHMLIVELADDLINNSEFLSDSVHLQVDAQIRDQVHSMKHNGVIVFNKSNLSTNEMGITNDD